MDNMTLVRTQPLKVRGIHDTRLAFPMPHPPLLAPRSSFQGPGYLPISQAKFGQAFAFAFPGSRHTSLKQAAIRTASSPDEDGPFCRSGRVQVGVPTLLSAPEFEEELTDPSTPILLYFTAPWCGPCKLMSPHLDKAAKVLQQRLRIIKVDADKHPEKATQYKAGALPTTILFDEKGSEIARKAGPMVEKMILSFVDDNVGK